MNLRESSTAFRQKGLDARVEGAGLLTTLSRGIGELEKRRKTPEIISRGPRFGWICEFDRLRRDQIVLDAVIALVVPDRAIPFKRAPICKRGAGRIPDLYEDH